MKLTEMQKHKGTVLLCWQNHYTSVILDKGDPMPRRAERKADREFII